MTDKSFYLAYFEINHDGDFYFECYKDLNFDHALFETFDEAVDAVKKHLKLAIDTISSSRDISCMKEFLERLYTDINWDALDKNDVYPLDIDTDLGNWDVRYYIKQVKFL